MGQISSLHHLHRPGLCLALLGLILLLPPGELATESGGIQPEVTCPSCEDFNGCTADSCDTVYGTCRHAPLNCNDGNPCTADSCMPGQFSTCQHTGLPTGTPCDDRNSCSIGDVCNAIRQCRGTFLPLGSSCSDGNGCTASDTCREGGICRGDFLNAGDSCEDGSLCTSGGTCVDEAGTLTCQSATTHCNDSDPCTQDTCDESTGQCAHPSVNCDDGNTCTTDTCDPSTGSCTPTIVSGCQEVTCPPCDDFNGCTVDSCDAFYGTCRHTPINCNDANPCTTDSCPPGPNSTCQHTGLPLGTACDDRNSCSIADVCNTSRQCRGTFLPLGSSCSDGNGCTVSDSCREGGICRGDFMNAGDSCDDGSLCTSGGTCVDEAGTLMCQSTARNCNDSNLCTIDTCVESTGLCTHFPVSCEDGNFCTRDACDPSTGSCTRTFEGAITCSDANLCTISDTCSHGNCIGESCDDGNPCTMEFCGGGFCLHDPRSGNPCTPVNKCLAPVCNQGSCGGLPITCIDGNLCTNDGCNPSTGCDFTPISCDDQDACTVESCNPQTGCAHTAVSCDDGIACTVDTCDPQSGCAHDPNCDDGNPCTTDVCDTASGCSHLPVPGVPPSIQVSLTPQSLFLANHQMVPITAAVSASGGCGGALTIRLESITSSEPDDAAGSGDGNTRNDIQEAAYGTADFRFSLRAERAGGGPGRTYRVRYSASDALGATATASADVIVPR